ncbi:MAG TPA: hypothetical protein VF395_19365 [Polyangiaceae bacterium]
MQSRKIAVLLMTPMLLVTQAGCGSGRRTTPSTPGARPAPAEPAKADHAAPKVATSPTTEPTISGTGDPPPPPSAPAPAPVPSADVTTSPVPKVKVTNIGLHVGGGPNDAATKAPFERAIQKQFDDFKRCYGKMGAPTAHGTFGIDLLIEKEGGHPKTSGSRTAMPDAFRDCVAHVFETVVFDRPRLGATKISYALKFDPEP